jgi:hypothetical protein
MNDNPANYILGILVAVVAGGLAGFLISRQNRPAWLQAYVPERRSALIGVALGGAVVGLIGVVFVATGSAPTDCEAVNPGIGTSSTAAVGSRTTVAGQSAPVASSGSVQRTSASQPASLPDTALVAQLENDATAYLNLNRCLVRFNNNLEIWIKMGAIAGAFLTTIASQQKWTFVGVASGALVTALTGAQAAFPLGDRANFYRVIEVRTDRILSDVRMGQLDMTGFEAARIALEDIKADGAKGPGTTATSIPVPSPTSISKPTGAG